MDNMPIKVVILGSIPEAIFMLWAGLCLVEEDVSTKQVIGVGVLQGITSYFIRRYSPFGVHSIIHIITLINYTYFIIKVRYRVAVISVLISFVIVFLVEGTVTILMHVNVTHVFYMDWERVLLFLPHNFVLAGIVYVCKKHKYSLLEESVLLRKIVREPILEKDY
ncbi:hypothetical protein IZY60_05305 [Lutibacter sp. B2]|nr:hypothetical protein [Lutibacter sp. B2]